MTMMGFERTSLHSTLSQLTDDDIQTAVAGVVVFHSVHCILRVTMWNAYVFMGGDPGYLDTGLGEGTKGQ